MKFPFFVIVGHADLPAETTCSAPDVVTADQVVATFAPGGDLALPDGKIARSEGASIVQARAFVTLLPDKRPAA